MKSAKKSAVKSVLIFVASVVVLAAAVLIGWRLWGKPLQSIIPVDGSGFTSIQVQITEFGSMDHFPVYQLNIGSPDDPNYDKVLSLLEGTKFRPDLRNLFSRPVNTVSSSGRSNTEYSAVIRLDWGTAAEDSCWLNFHGADIVSLSLQDKDGFLIYHPSNRSTLEQLAEYVRQHGEELKS